MCPNKGYVLQLSLSLAGELDPIGHFTPSIQPSIQISCKKMFVKIIVVMATVRIGGDGE